MKNEYKTLGDTTIIYVKKKNGKVFEVLIDTEDFDLVNETVNALSVYEDSHTSYATYRDKTSKKVKQLHRLIMNPPDDLVVDHKFHNGLDNRKKHLRICTHKQNAQNSKPRTKNTKYGDKYRGVYWVMSTGKYRASVTIDGVAHNLGTYDTPEEANEVVVAFRRKHMPFSTI